MNKNVKKLVLLAMFSAVAYLLVALIRIPLVPAVPFLHYEPKDVILVIAGVLMGPIASLIIAALVALLEMVTISSTGPIGCLMNFLSSAAFACTAAIIYKRTRTATGAAFGLSVGSVATAILMLLWNWLITPLYMGVSRDVVVQLLFPAFLPFNLLKGGFNSALALGLYKPLVTALRRSHLIDQREGQPTKSKYGIYILAGSLLLTCTVLVLLLQSNL